MENKVLCPRCGGSGKVEFSHVAEGTCFMCGGFGLVFKSRIGDLTEKAKKIKATKEAKKEAKIQEMKEDRAKEISESHILGKKGFEIAINKNTLNIESSNAFIVAFGMYNEMNKGSFNAEMFLNCVTRFTGVNISQKINRLAIVSYFRKNKIFNSSLEYSTQTSHDYNEFINELNIEDR